jgi:hypothetical protein
MVPGWDNSRCTVTAITIVFNVVAIFDTRPDHWPDKCDAVVAQVCGELRDENAQVGLRDVLEHVIRIHKVVGTRVSLPKRLIGCISYHEAVERRLERAPANSGEGSGKLAVFGETPFSRSNQPPER